MVVKSTPLGVLMLERGLPAVGVIAPPPLGSLRHSATFDFPVIYETVAGAWVDVSQAPDRARGRGN